MSEEHGHTLHRAGAEETHAAILRAARDLFSRLGYRAVTTRMVAEASGVKQPLLYYHFGDKEALYLEVVREDAQTVRAALTRIAARRQESIDERFYQVVRYLYTSKASAPNMGLFFHEMKHEMSPVAREALQQLFFESVVQPLCSLFEDGMRSGALRSSEQSGVTPNLATYILLSILSHLEIAMDTNKNIWPGGADNERNINELICVLVRTLLYGIAQRPATPPDTKY